LREVALERSSLRGPNPVESPEAASLCTTLDMETQRRYLGAMYEDLRRHTPGPSAFRLWRSLRYIAAHPGASSHQVAQGAGVSHEGQMSRLGSRLLELGLVERAGGPPPGWTATAAGARAVALLDHHPLASVSQLVGALERGAWGHEPRAAWLS
jgi:hypothetical protein